MFYNIIKYYIIVYYIKNKIIHYYILLFHIKSNKFIFYHIFYIKYQFFFQK
jgi:hypothetical protein